MTPTRTAAWLMLAAVLLPARVALAQYDDDDLFEDDEEISDGEEGADSEYGAAADDLELDPNEPPPPEGPPEFAPQAEETTWLDSDAEEPGDAGAAPGGFGGPLVFSKNTLAAGGLIAVDIDTHSAHGATNVGGAFTFAPNMGWFVIDNLELLGELGVALPFGDANAISQREYETPVRSSHSPVNQDDFTMLPTASVFFNLGAQYVFDLGVLALYAGGLFGMNFDILDIDITVINDTSSDQFNWTKTKAMTSILLTVPAGVLLPLGRFVAVDLGTRLIFDIGVGDNPNTYIHIPIGYLGLQGFFGLPG